MKNHFDLLQYMILLSHKFQNKFFISKFNI